MAKRIVVVGASLAGLKAVEQLRGNGWTDAISVVGAEPWMPYDRSLLSRHLESAGVDARSSLGKPFLEALALPRSPLLGEVDWRLGNPAVSCSIEDKQLTLADGQRVRWDGLVIATGLRPRRLALHGHEEQRFVVHTLEDATRLRSRLTAGRKVTIVGAGFLACEIAATATQLGCAVTVIDSNTAPMERPLGSLVGRLLQRYQEARGVRFVLGQRVEGFSTSAIGELNGLRLSNGSLLPTEIVVETLGFQGNVNWLAGNGLDLHDGVLCNDRLQLPGHPGVVAVGDVARFVNPLYRAITQRPEHWAAPDETARRAAVSLTAQLLCRKPRTTPFRPLPQQESNLFSLRLQVIGAPGYGQKMCVLDGDPSQPLDDRSTLAIGYLKGTVVTGVLLVNLPHRTRAFRQLVANSLEEPQQEALEHA
ncbi:NAD(P)/FAD-dependent oxidoreductase [Metapseudomonas resinovorans]|uniref:Putative ferredoxin reductase n=1 Tax=Metapseudomonas resinovorans NBRC 106553 TaxID=1245471 RepID=S6B0F1_METRE|nr:FAD-dependent oxidoreductase [Pseudomonas resinovorans]BAN50696.1 putative ferredoxin reductase [Pseudomonas resinovorans NBRC 106553]